MAEDEFTKLFKYMQKGFADVNAKFDNCASKEDVAKLQDAVDFLIGEYKKSQSESAADDHAHRRIDDKLDELSATADDHETRLGQLESLAAA